MGSNSGAGSAEAAPIRIRVNGAEREAPGGSTVADLVASLGLRPKYVAVERNETLVPRAEHSLRALEPGDRIEIVTLVGGG